MRRVITGQRDGKSVIIEDAEKTPMESPFLGVIQLGSTTSDPQVPLSEPELLKGDAFKFPTAGETNCAISIFPPDREVFEKAEAAGTDAREAWRAAFHDDYAMHRTDTIDYDFILSGEVWLELDDGAEVHLKAGDCVIVSGTRHGWHNRSDAACVMATIMVGAKRAA